MPINPQSTSEEEPRRNSNLMGDCATRGNERRSRDNGDPPPTKKLTPEQVQHSCAMLALVNNCYEKKRQEALPTVEDPENGGSILMNQSRTSLKDKPDPDFFISTEKANNFAKKPGDYIEALMNAIEKKEPT